MWGILWILKYMTLGINLDESQNNGVLLEINGNLIEINPIQFETGEFIDGCDRRSRNMFSSGRFENESEDSFYAKS